MKRLRIGILSVFAVTTLPLGCVAPTKSEQAALQSDRAPDAIIFIRGMT